MQPPRRLDRAAVAILAGGLVLAGLLLGVAATRAPGPSVEVSRVPATTAQPGQWSGLALDPDGLFWTLTDAGPAARENGGFGSVGWPLQMARIDLQQPTSLLGPPIYLHEGTRRLTGADADPEDLALAADGTLWLCDESPTPSLLHVARDGSVLERILFPAKYGTPLPNHGPEAVALGTDQRTVFVSTQTQDAAQNESASYAFLAYDIANRTFTESTYPFGDPDPVLRANPLTRPWGISLSGMAAVGPRSLLVLERSSGEGNPEPPKFKAIYRVDVPAEANTTLEKRLVYDLEAADYKPLRPEGLAVVDAHHLAILNDNNAKGATLLWVIELDEDLLAPPASS